MKRREFLSWTVKAGAVLMLPAIWTGCKGGNGGSAVALPDLPYPANALEPYISEKTIGFHYGKHHKGYVDKVNRLTKGTRFAGISLEEMIIESSGKEGAKAVFNNAAQVFNHTFYWNSMSPDGGGEPTGAVSEKMKASFGSVDKFKNEFVSAATGQFGSGWAWLVQRDEAFEIVATANADTPIAHGLKPLMVIDVWEHAYYLDYQNKRKEYVEACLEHLVNWAFVEENVAVAD
jgi:Fe-Mn family superoxide dismutase